MICLRQRQEVCQVYGFNSLL